MGRRIKVMTIMTKKLLNKKQSPKRSDTGMGASEKIYKRRVKKMENTTRKNKNQRGFALIFTLFLVIGITALAAGMFLSVSRHHRSVERNIDRTQTDFAAQAVIDKGIKLANDYRQITGDYPVVDTIGKEASGANEVEGSIELFKDYLSDWFNGLKVAGEQFADSLSHINLVKISVILKEKPPSGGPAIDLWRRYEIKVHMKHDITGVESYVSQVIKMYAAGNLFDYAVFYYHDLEIASGPNFDLQGPIFTNSDVYMMTGRGSTLTLKAPNFSDDSAAENYALHSAGNLYYYFKRFVGKNYLLDENPKYANLVRDIVDPTRSLGDLDDYLVKDVISGNYVEMNGVDNRTLPYFYYAKNDIRKGNYTTDDPPGSTEHLIRVKQDTAYTSFEAKDFGTSSVYYGYIYYTHYLNAEGYSAPLNSLNSSPAYIMNDTIFEISDDWSQENPISAKPYVWNSAINIEGGLIESGVESKNPPTGIGNAEENANHTLIEPIVITDGAYGDENGDGFVDSADTHIRNQKLQSEAEIQFLCADDNCTSYSVYQIDGITLQNPAGLSFGGSIISFYDYRLKKSVKTIEIDINTLHADMMTSNVTDQKDTGYVVYVETLPMKESGTNDSVRAVLLSDWTSLKEDGMSVVTNGRLWIKGNYNTNGDNSSTCSAQNTAPDCTPPPPAAIFSDSFGALSTSYTITDSETDLDARLAGTDLIINAAIVTGHLPSQLEEAFSGCTGDAGNDENCRNTVMTNEWISLVGDEYIPGKSGAVQGASCPNGIGSNDGNSDCDYIKDTNTGVFYYKRTALIKRIYQAMQTHQATAQYLNDNGLPGYFTEGEPEYPVYPALGLVPDLPPLEDGGIKTILGEIIDDTITEDTIGANLDALRNDPNNTMYFSMPYAEEIDGVWKFRAEYITLEGDNETYIYDPNNGEHIFVYDGDKDDDSYKAWYSADELDSMPEDVRIIWEEFDLDFTGVPDWWIPVNTDAKVKEKEKDYYRNDGYLEPKSKDDTLRATAVFPGMWFRVLNGKFERGFWLQRRIGGGIVIVEGGGETGGGTVTYRFAKSVSKLFYGKIAYSHGRYIPLYIDRYSGGFENLINYQEKWGDYVGDEYVPSATVFLSGALSSLWHAEELWNVNESKPAYYMTEYYMPPTRIFDYNEYLREDKPAASPGLYSIKRERYKELSLDEPGQDEDG